MVSVFRSFGPIVQMQAGHTDDERAATQGLFFSGSAASALGCSGARSTEECRTFETTTSRVVGLLHAAKILGPDLSQKKGDDVALPNSRAEDLALTDSRSTNAESIWSASSDSESSGMNCVGEQNDLSPQRELYRTRKCV